MNVWIAERMIQLVILLLSLTVHEWAHAWSAWRLGDDTAHRLGRMTLDPLAHIDPLGALLPMLGAPVGWARPVPVNPTNFAVDTRLGMMLTAAAGPVSNLLIALSSAALLAALRASAPAFTVRWGVDGVLVLVVTMNVLLAAFNLLPVPPLDGSRILEWRLPASLRGLWDQAQGLGHALLVAVVVIPPLFGVNLFAPAQAFASWLVSPVR